MWYFEAHYTNMDDLTEVVKPISFDGQFFDSEKECYIYAMSMAYDMMEKNESLDILEFLAC